MISLSCVYTDFVSFSCLPIYHFSFKGKVRSGSVGRGKTSSVGDSRRRKGKEVSIRFVCLRHIRTREGDVGSGG